MTGPLYINYGCGLSAPDGWLNFDGSPRLAFERVPLVGTIMRSTGKALFPANVRYGNIVSGLPVADNSARGVYCSHVLEHIDRAGIEVALRNTHRILAPGGTFRLIVPDIKWRAENLLSEIAKGTVSAADDFMREAYLGKEQRARGMMGRLRAMMGNSDHLWMYDHALMKRLLEEAGFTDIRPCEFGDAQDPKFHEVEDEGRFFDSGHKEVAIEAKKRA